MPISDCFAFRARTQYEIASHPILVKQLQEPLLNVLQAALESHRYALNLDRDNADALFNTAHVMTSIAEEIPRDDRRSHADALRMLEEALELLQRCLTLQEFQYSQDQEREANAAEAVSGQPDVPDPSSYSGSHSEGEIEERWASIIEPVTKDTLIDTLTAQLSVLTALCGLLGESADSAPNASLASIEEYCSNLLKNKLPSYTDTAALDFPKVQDILLAKANLIFALLEAAFRSGKLDAQTFWIERDAAFAAKELRDSPSATILLADATSLLAFNSALLEMDIVQADVNSYSSLRWKALATAISRLSDASKIQGVGTGDTARSHFLRGDASMLQWQLGQPPILYPAATSNAAALLKNAEVFYRNASKLWVDQEEKDMALMREAVASYIQDRRETEKFVAITERRGADWAEEQVADMVEEGLLFQDELERLDQAM